MRSTGEQKGKQATLLVFPSIRMGRLEETDRFQEAVRSMRHCMRHMGGGEGEKAFSSKKGKTSARNSMNSSRDRDVNLEQSFFSLFFLPLHRREIHGGRKKKSSLT